MTTRAPAAAVAVILAATLLHAPATPRAQAQSAAGPPPNLVVVMTDDQTLDSLSVMPVVRRRLGSAGVTFTNSFASYPLCCPSRATYLTGQYSHNSGVRFNYAPTGGWSSFDDAAPTAFPVALRRAGYHTAHFGKVMNQYGHRDPQEIPPGWSHWEAMLEAAHRRRFVGMRINRNGSVQNLPVTPHYYNTDYFARRAVKHIRRRAATGQPFFVNLALFAPHGLLGNGPTIPADRHVGAFAGVPLPRPPSFNEPDMADKPVHLRRGRLSAKRIAGITRAYRWRLESLLAVDEAVEDILNALAAAGVADNTVVVFTSDNGFLHGEHRIRRGKWHVYDESTRVPLLVSGPGVRRGQRVATPVANIDLAPTLLDFAGVEPLNDPDGRSLVPLLRGDAATFDRDLLITTGYGRARRWYTAIRSDRYLYVEHVQDAAGEEVFAEELYDLRDDPYQLRSLHASVAHSEIRDDLRATLYRLRRCAGTSCHSRDRYPPPIDDDGGEPVPQDEVVLSGPIDDPEDHPEFFTASGTKVQASGTRTVASLRQPAARVVARRRTRLVGTVTTGGRPFAGALVRLQRRTIGTGDWIHVATAVTASTGRVVFRPRVFGSARWRLALPAQRGARAATSNVERMLARPRIPTRVQPGTVAAGSPVQLRGTVIPNRRGQVVALQRRRGTRWETVARQRLGRASGFRFTVRASRRPRRFRVLKPATPTLVRAAGAVRTVAAHRVVPFGLAFDPPGADGARLNGEQLVLRNTGRVTTDLRGWTVRGRHAATTHALPRYRLRPGGRVVVHTGKGRRRPGHIHLGLTRPLWGNRGDVAVVADRDGVVMGRWRAHAVRVARVAPGRGSTPAEQVASEAIVLRNVGTSTAPLRRWTVHVAPGGASPRLAGVSLAPGARLVVHAGRGRDRRGHLFLGRRRELLPARGRVALADRAGVTVHTFRYRR